jgi:ATP-binding cassette, subfamily G (WHITE), eye pigment precursor transporter
VLNFRNKGKLIVDGRIKINGRDIDSNAQLSEISAYIEQEDMFIGYLKVKEQMRFQAELKMKRDMSKEDRDKKIEQIMLDLNLKKCEDTLIGVADRGIKGISGGERRRLSFACAMLTDPNLLFCDEPTSGLDSFMAMSIVDTLRKLADKGKTIICTIHQPSSVIFQKLDRLCLLAEGRLAFIGDHSDVNKFFETQGFPIPELYNPADHFIKTLSVMPSDRENSLIKIDKICESYLKSYSYSKNEIAINEANMLEDNLNYDVDLSTKVQYRSNVLVQFRWLLWRSSLSVLRDPRSSYIALIQTIFISVILGLVYLQQKNDQPGIQNINGVLFLMLLNSSFSNMFAVINLYSFELPIMMKEHKDGMYRIVSYYLAKTVVDLPLYTFNTFIYVTILYWMANLNNGPLEYITAVIIIIFVVNVSIAFGKKMIVLS